jgi:lipopolysaccharide export system protein LptA
MTQNNLFLLGICFLLGWQSAQSQTEQSRLEILHADALRKGKGYDRLLDSVVMKHKNSLIYCDSAHFYGQDQLAKLFGNVKIENQEDSVTVTSRYAEYDGETQLAKLRTNVVLVNEGTTLYTDFLDYNRETGVANYYNTGMVKDSINTLTSQRGVYETRDEKITFRDKVVLENPDYTMKSKILYYFTLTKIAETEKLTNILSKEGDKLNAQRGSVYDTENKIFRFYDGNVESENSVVSGEILYYDENAQYFEARENVSIFNKEQNVEVFGEEGKYWEDLQYSRVYGRALVRKYFEADTLFMIADTLVTQDSDVPEERYMLAYPDMRMIKSTLAGRADSMAYTYADSTVYLFSDPVLWNNKSQITADSIRFLLANEEIDRALLVDNAFAITRDTVANFNQIKGRKMTSYFAEGDIEGVGDHKQGIGFKVLADQRPAVHPGILQVFPILPFLTKHFHVLLLVEDAHVFSGLKILGIFIVIEDFSRNNTVFRFHISIVKPKNFVFGIVNAPPLRVEFVALLGKDVCQFFCFGDFG